MQKIEKKGNYISVSKTKAKMVKQKIQNPVLNVIAHIVAYVMFIIYMLPIINVLVFSFTDGMTIRTGVIRRIPLLWKIMQSCSSRRLHTVPIWSASCTLCLPR